MLIKYLLLFDKGIHANAGRIVYGQYMQELRNVYIDKCE